MTPADLHGAWRLLSFQIDFADGRPPALPFGQAPQGRLVYTPSGHMMAALARPDRAPLGVSRLETGGRAPAAAKAAAFESYLSYAGRWWLEGDAVVHAVELALVPEAVGRENRRAATLADGQLCLRYQLTPKSGVTRTYTLR